MTIEEVTGPALVPVASGVAVVAVALLFWYVARRYSAAPKRVPIGLRLDGRPRRIASKRWLWLGPGIMAVVVAVLAIFFVVEPPAAEQRTSIALVFIVIAELTWFAAWTNDRLIELARGMTYRVPPIRTLRVFAPILATIVVLFVLAIRPL